jgi:hypothetical protein
MPLSIRVSGSGSSWVDVDGIGLWRGSTVGELADPRLACPNDMVNGGHFCIEPTPTSKSAAGFAGTTYQTWRDANIACRARGRRLCSGGELGFAYRWGITAGNNVSGAPLYDFWSHSEQAGCYINTSINHGSYPIGYQLCNADQNFNYTYIGRLCCQSR